MAASSVEGKSSEGAPDGPTQPRSPAQTSCLPQARSRYTPSPAMTFLALIGYPHCGAEALAAAAEESGLARKVGFAEVTELMDVVDNDDVRTFRACFGRGEPPPPSVVARLWAKTCEGSVHALVLGFPRSVEEFEVFSEAAREPVRLARVEVSPEVVEARRAALGMVSLQLTRPGWTERWEAGFRPLLDLGQRKGVLISLDGTEAAEPNLTALREALERP